MPTPVKAGFETVPRIPTVRGATRTGEVFA